MNCTALATLSLLVAAAVPGRAAAQEPWPVSLELQAGLAWTQSNGAFRGNDPGVGAQVTVGSEVFTTRRGRVFAAVSYAAQGTGAMTDVCILLPDGSCKPGIPSFEWISLLGGWERASTSLRFLTGPAALRAHGDWERMGLAWVARVDAFTGSAGHLALSASLRSAFVPAYGGNRFLLTSLGVGLRIR